MKNRLLTLLLVPLLLQWPAPVLAAEPDPARDILVTFENEGARAMSAGSSAPYKNRKRYAVSADVRRHALDIEDEYALVEIDHWPIRALAVYCFVYRVPEDVDRDALIQRLAADERVESVQPLNTFEASTRVYDDTYANLQHGLVALDIGDAHRYSRGENVRVAIIDSHVDTDHEDLVGRVSRIRQFADGRVPDAEHGTAVASLIAANANNAMGIVGVAPEAAIEVFVACWAEAGAQSAVCDSFSLAKALDTMLQDPPRVLNLSLRGRADPLVARLLTRAYEGGVVIVAAGPDEASPQDVFPASHAHVIGVGTSVMPRQRGESVTGAGVPGAQIYAPGNEILVAMPDNNYDFRSGSSLAAAQVSGVIALLLAVAPEMKFATVRQFLEESQPSGVSVLTSINACVVLQLADPSRACSSDRYPASEIQNGS